MERKRKHVINIISRIKYGEFSKENLNLESKLISL